MYRFLPLVLVLLGPPLLFGCGASGGPPPTVTEPPTVIASPSTVTAPSTVTPLAPTTGGISSDGQRVLIEASDVPDFGYAASAEDMWLKGGFFAKAFHACDGGDPLLEEIGPNGPDVVLGRGFGQRPLNVFGGQGVASLALRGRNDDSASRTQALLSSTGFWNCVTNEFVDASRSAGIAAQNAGVRTLHSAGGAGLSVATEAVTDRTTSDPSRTPFTDHSVWVVVRAGNNLVLLLLDNNDGPFPESLRTRLTLLTEQRLQPLAPPSGN